MVRGVRPLEEPQVVVVVFVERGGSGGQVAAPIAREVSQGRVPRKVVAARSDAMKARSARLRPPAQARDRRAGAG